MDDALPDQSASSNTSHVSIGLEIHNVTHAQAMMETSQGNGYQFGLINILQPSIASLDVRDNHVIGHPFLPTDLILSSAGLFLSAH